REQRVNAEWAVQQVFHEFSGVFDEVADPYLRERKGDLSDLVGRLRMNLRQGVATARDLLRDLDESSVLIADELTPSFAAQVDWAKVRGFATDAGSRTYHTAILARSLEVPAVVGLHDASRIIEPGQLVVIDGSGSEVTIEPSEEVLALARRRMGGRSGSRKPPGPSRAALEPDAAGALPGAAASAPPGGAVRPAPDPVSLRLGRRTTARGPPHDCGGGSRSRAARPRR